MPNEDALNDWFCSEVLPLEQSLARYIRRNSRAPNEIFDLIHDVYALVIKGAMQELPRHTRAYVFKITKNHLIRQASRAQAAPIDFVADMQSCEPACDIAATERYMEARDELRHLQKRLDKLPPRCRQVVYLRKIEGLTTREAAARLNVGIDAIEQQLVKGMRFLADFDIVHEEISPIQDRQFAGRRRLR